MITATKSKNKKVISKITSQTKRVKFEINAPPFSDVHVAGTFNNWDPTDIKLEEDNRVGLFSAYITLPKGKHEYKFIVNDVWMLDPGCPEWVPNNFGSLNSIITVE